MLNWIHGLIFLGYTIVILFILAICAVLFAMFDEYVMRPWKDRYGDAAYLPLLVIAAAMVIVIIGAKL